MKYMYTKFMLYKRYMYINEIQNIVHKIYVNEIHHLSASKQTKAIESQSENSRKSIQRSSKIVDNRTMFGIHTASGNIPYAFRVPCSTLNCKIIGRF